MNHDELMEMIEALEQPVNHVQPVVVDQVFMEAIELSHRLDEEENARNLAARVEAQRIRTERLHQALVQQQEFIWTQIKMKNLELLRLEDNIDFLNLVIQLAHE